MGDYTLAQKLIKIIRIMNGLTGRQAQINRTFSLRALIAVKEENFVEIGLANDQF